MTSVNDGYDMRSSQLRAPGFRGLAGSSKREAGSGASEPQRKRA